MGEKRRREAYEAECVKRMRMREEMDRERRIDAIRFEWFCIGTAFAVVLAIAIAFAIR